MGIAKNATPWWYLKQEDQVSHTGVMPGTPGEREMYAEQTRIGHFSQRSAAGRCAKMTDSRLSADFVGDDVTIPPGLAQGPDPLAGGPGAV